MILYLKMILYMRIWVVNQKQYFWVGLTLENRFLKVRWVWLRCRWNVSSPGLIPVTSHPVTSHPLHGVDAQDVETFGHDHRCGFTEQHPPHVHLHHLTCAQRNRAKTNRQTDDQIQRETSPCLRRDRNIQNNVRNVTTQSCLKGFEPLGYQIFLLVFCFCHIFQL